MNILMKILLVSINFQWSNILADSLWSKYYPTTDEQDESRLLVNITSNYNPFVRPVKNASKAVIIRLSITLTQIFDLDEKNQVLTTNVWLDQEWYDELLTWNPQDFNGIKTFRIPCEKIWVPDIVLYNNADDYTRGYMQSKAMLRYDGNVFWPPPTKFRSTCPVDVTYFPFDDQTCLLKLGSWTYDGFQVDVTNRTDQVDLSNYVPNGEWELLDAKIVRNVVYYSCCPEPFPDVTITVIIRRKTLFYLYNVVLPCAMMSALTLLVFCLPPDSGEKIALGITVLLAFSVFMLAIAEKMPETSESIPLIGIYLTTVMSITSLSVIMTVVVLNFHHRGPIRKQVPLILRRLVLDGNWSKSKKIKISEDNHEDAVPLTTTTVDKLAEEIKMQRGCREHSSSESVNNLNVNDVFKRNVRHCDSQLNEELVRMLRYLLSKEEEEAAAVKVVNEWRQIAAKVDRFLFWVFFVGTVASFICVLVIVPMERRGFGYT